MSGMNAVVDQVRKFFEETPQGRAAIKHVEAATLHERQELRKKLDALHEEAERVLPSLWNAKEAPRKRLEAAREAFQKAAQDVGQANARYSQESTRLTGAISRIEHELKISADPSIAAFIEELQTIHGQGHASLQTQRYPGKENPLTGKRGPEQHFSNSQSLAVRLQAIRDAISVARALCLEACDDLPARLEQIKATIPRVDGITYSPDLPAAIPELPPPARPPGFVERGLKKIKQ